MTPIEQAITQDDATLLLHVAGELDGQALWELKDRLSREESLRARLGAMTAIDAAIRSEANAMPISMADSRRALSVSLRLVREQALSLQNRPQVRFGRGGLAGIPRWGWATAVAACVAVASVVWISNSDPSQVPPTAVGLNVPGNIDGSFRGGENGGLAAAFGSIEPAGTEGAASEIDTQVDALKLLAAMDDVN